MAGCTKTLLWMTCAIALSGCSAIVDADQRKLGPSPVPCDPKLAPASCVCLDGTTSVQRCNALGRYDPCACVSASSGSGGSAGEAGNGGSGSS